MSTTAMSDAADSAHELPLQSPEHDHRIDYIELPATDVAATRAFYAGAFGWKFTDYGPDYTSFEDGRLTGGFHRAGAVTPGGPLVIIFAMDLADAERRVVEAGGRVVKPVFSFPGGRRFHFADPSGNELAVWSDR
jgi:uncharacterized protein